MSSTLIFTALERERELLQNIICLSEEQHLMLAEEDLGGFDTLLDRRADLTREISEIEEILMEWISSIDTSISPDILARMRAINEEVIRMADHVVKMDKRSQTILNLILIGLRRSTDPS